MAITGHIRIPARHRAEFVPHAPEEQPLPEEHVAGTAVASAVSPGTELGWAFTSENPTVFPAQVGYAMVFRVTQAGAKSGFAVGDLAFAMSSHRSHIRTGEAWKVPAGLAPADAALARLAAVSWTTLATTAARPPARVAVCGLGIVGNLAAQILDAAGYQVCACDPVATRRALLAGRGIDLRERLPLGDPDWQDRVDLVVDCSGHEAAALDACRLVRKGGEVVLVGVPWRKRTELPAFDLLHAVFHRYVHLRSGWEWEVPRQPSDFRHGSIRENLEGALAWLASGRLRTTGLYRVADPREPQPVYEALRDQRGELTAVFDWDRA